MVNAKLQKMTSDGLTTLTPKNHSNVSAYPQYENSWYQRLIILHLAKTPGVAADATTEVGHRLVRASRLQLVVARLLPLALGTRQYPLVLFVIARLDQLPLRVELSILPNRLGVRTIRPQLVRCHPTNRLWIDSLFVNHLPDQLWVAFEVEENAQQLLLVPMSKVRVVPARRDPFRELLQRVVLHGDLRVHHLGVVGGNTIHLCELFASMRP